MRILLATGVLLVTCACLDDSRCRPEISYLSSDGYSPAFNEAEWVFDYNVEGYGPFHGENNTLLTEGQPATREFILLDTAACSERGLRVEGPQGAVVKRVPRIARGEGAIPSIEIVNVRVDWIPARPGKVPLSIGQIANFEFEVARDLTGLNPLAVLPRSCDFVGRFGDGFVCDSWVYWADGGSTSLGDRLVFDVQGNTMLASGLDGGAAAYLTWNEAGAAFDGGLLQEPALAQRPVLVGSTIYYVTGATLRAVDVPSGLTTEIPAAKMPRALSRFGSELMWLEGSSSGIGNRVCRLGADAGASCELLNGQVKPVGTDRGIWVETEVEQNRTLVLWDLGPNGFGRATGPLVRSRGVSNAPLGLMPPFRQAFRPGVLSTRSICAFREVSNGHIGVAVYPEGDVHSHRRHPSFARGGGREGLRWCTDLILTKTFVYEVDTLEP
jgi:hypothetical protein